MVGYIDHFAFSPADEMLGFPTRSWLTICEHAYALTTDGRSQSRDPATDLARSQATKPLSVAVAGEDAKSDDEWKRMRDLLLDFESLGAHWFGCEFGLFQRDCGAEPLHLMRWAEISPGQLVAALDCEFDGVGLPENTEMIVVKGGAAQGEYESRDRRFGMRMHTFVRSDEMPHDQMHRLACKRLQFLRTHLLNDLRDGSKIFVYKNALCNLTDGELRKLHVAVRRYGNNMLLYVQYADELHPNGTVEFVSPGLMIGYIDRFAISPDGEMGAPATDSVEGNL